MRVFVTGASGWLGSATVPELIAAGHQVVGLARSETSAETLVASGADVVKGTLEDLDVLAAAAAASDGVIHLAFNHELAFGGDFQAAADADRLAVETFGEVLAGSDRPLLIASGVLGLAPGRLATEEDGRQVDPILAAAAPGPSTRQVTGHVTLALADRGVRSAVVRLPPTCHGDGDNGFMSTLVGIARAKGISAYVGNSGHWPAAHRLDVGNFFRLALEEAPAGSALHAVAEEGVSLRLVAEVIGRHLEVPVIEISPEQAGEHFGYLATFVGLDSRASSAWSRALLGWEPTNLGLIEDLEAGHYFAQTLGA